MIKISLKELQYFLLVIITISVFVVAAFWYTTSSFSYNEYLRICHPADIVSDNCMKPYWDQYKIDKPTMSILEVVLMASIIIFGVTEVKSRLK